ncbi:SH3 domain-containing protein [Streptomyces sp. NPDC050529]|uniref:SH3 domain-containing protein n=1 Tax=unclassified Streptomyces TaxID=2593676 RepID=UPI002DD8300D|nr:SH3 domain-containing protein [Streptomyces sp. NBC_01022]MEE4494875.1 SH3 domain-containing protein [Streptomyces sp. BE230]WRZ85441.1 SH3 domain-containing protein [Streptomyces sp. NBC_01022]
MMKKILLAAAMLTAGLGLAVSPAAQAAPSAVAAHSVEAAPTQVCTVNDNGVNFRGGPGTDYPVLGQVNRGQNLDARGQEGSWVMGDLWGGPTGVWIHVAYLDC